MISTIHQSRNCDTGLLSWIPVLARTPMGMMDLSGDCDNTENNVEIIYFVASWRQVISLAMNTIVIPSVNFPMVPSNDSYSNTDF